MASSTSSQASDSNAVLVAFSAAASDGYGRPAAIAPANRRDAQHDSITATASPAGDALNDARVTRPANHATAGKAMLTRGYPSCSFR